MMNPFFDLLHQEHELVATIIKDIEYTPPERSTELEDRWTALKRALLPHIVAEENTYYPVIQSRPESRDDALRNLEEHHAIEAQLFEVNNMPMSPSGEWFNRFNRLKDMIQQHVRFEESTIFQDTTRVLDNNEIPGILENYRKAEEDARKNMAGATREVS